MIELHLTQLFIKTVTWSPVIQIFILALGALISFLVAYHQGDVTIYLPFISETGATIPEMGIFSGTLIFGSFFGVIVVLYRFGIMFYLLPSHDEKLKMLNKVSVIVGVISMGGLAGVAAFPMSVLLEMHLVAAGIHFALGFVYVVLQTYFSFKTVEPYHSKCSSVMRAVLTIFSMIFMLLLIALFPIAFVKWRSVYPDKPKALKTPDDQFFGLLFCASLFEWLFYITFMTYMFTFMSEFRKFAPEMRVRPIEEKREKTIDNPI